MSAKSYRKGSWFFPNIKRTFNDIENDCLSWKFAVESKKNYCKERICKAGQEK